MPDANTFTPLQVAEAAVRQATGVDEVNRVRLAACETEGDADTRRTTTTWAVGPATWRVVVDTTVRTRSHRSPSGKDAPKPPPDVHTVVEVTDVEAAGRGAAGWDDAHAAAENLGEPNQDVVAAVEGLPPGRAIDIACGTGRHSIWLAEHGWRVTGLDFSRSGLARAEAEATTRALEVDWQLGDARLWAPTEPVDLVLMAFVQLPGVLARAAGWVASAGHLVVVGHARRNHTEGVGGPSDPRLLHDPDELRAVAESAGLQVLRCAEVERTTPEGRAIDAVLVARAPKAG